MALHFSHEEFERRLTHLREKMSEQSIDCMLLFSQESMYWLTGYDTFGFCFFQCMIVRKQGEITLLTRSADLRQARHTSIVKDVHIWIDRADASPVIQLRDLLDNLDLLGAKFGIEYDTPGLNAKYGRALDEALTTFGERKDASGIIPALRSVKSFAEIDYVREAAKLCDDAYDAALEEIRPGADEGKILAAMHNAIFSAGGDYPGNEFIIGSGHDALLCRYKSGRRTLSEHDQLTLEWAGTARHYHAAMMQTIPIGTVTDRHEELFYAAKAALNACAGAMVPGKTFGDVFEAHAKEIDSRGLYNVRLNACGYSLGAAFTPCWMDMPMFYRNNPAVIEPNMVLFAHMILFDSETDTAMTLGRTFLTTDAEPEHLSRHAPDLVSK